MKPERRSLRDLSPDASARGVSDATASLPAHQSDTYYERPLLKRPHWEWEVISYLFMGGVMGGSGILVCLARDPQDAVLKRSARYVAFGLAATCPIVLIAHLGRPERFLHMLRIVKFKSVMSMGVWGLVAFSLPTAVAALAQAARDGLLPAPLRIVGAFAPGWLFDPLQALLGAFIGGYTGVLISATAIPFWAIGKRHIPAISVCSGLAGACALNGAIVALWGGDERTLRRVERLELVASLAEFALLTHFRRHAGTLGAPMFTGSAGKRLRTYTEIGGIALPAVLNLLPIHGRWKTLVASTLTLVGGYVLRERLIEGGKDSADDPRAASRQPE